MIEVVKFLPFLLLFLFSCASQHTTPKKRALAYTPCPISQDLRDLARRKKKLIGTAVHSRAFAENTRYRKALEDDWNLATPEYAMKMSFLEPEKEQFDFRESDAIARFAQKQQMVMRGHVLVWHRELPEWAEKESGDAEALRNTLKSYITTVVGHYRSEFPGLLRYWDVVNEAVDDTASLRRDSLWADIGNDYIELAFRWAHEADPAAKLFYNDYGIEEMNPKSDRVYRLVKKLLERGVPIHGVGFQMHLGEGLKHDFASMEKNLERFRKLRLRVHITELDVRLKVDEGEQPSPAQLKLQADLYARAAGLCLASPTCDVIGVWGLSDAYSYIPDLHDGYGAGHLYDEDMAAKPAYCALKKALTLTSHPR